MSSKMKVLKGVSLLNLILPFLFLFIVSANILKLDADYFYSGWYFALFGVIAIAIIAYIKKYWVYLNKEDGLLVLILNSSYLLLVCCFYSATLIFPYIK